MTIVPPALQRTQPSRSGCNPRLSWAGSPSFMRSAKPCRGDLFVAQGNALGTRRKIEIPPSPRGEGDRGCGEIFCAPRRSSAFMRPIPFGLRASFVIRH
jgi:hypothetical protein